MPAHKKSIPGDIVKVIKDIPRTNIFAYVNSNSLSEEYFKIAEKALSEPYIYIVLSSTGSPASNVIEFFTKDMYSHASLAFDFDLKTIVSYNGGNGLNPPGMNYERVEFFLQKPDARMAVYRIKATFEQKKTILDEVRRINIEGSSYNITGVVLAHSFLDNILVCSQFVYRLLQKAGLCYFGKDAAKVRPIDFFICDSDGVLELCDECYIKDFVNCGQL